VKNDKVLQKYWTALGKGDGKTMATCYADDATFRDPIFALTGAEIGAMWRYLMDGKGDLVVATKPLLIDNGTARGEWTATYTFTATGRKVVNHIFSNIEAHDGKIVAQEDLFPFWKWSRMALGTSGALLGWTPIVKNKVRRMAAKRLKP